VIYPLSDLALAQRLERAEGTANKLFVDARARLFPDRGACWIEAAGAYAMFDGVESPLTQTFGLGLSGTPSAAEMDTLERFFRDRHASVHHETSPVAGHDLVKLLVDRGYHPIEYTSVLYQPISIAERGLETPPVEVHRIDGDEHDVWTRTFVDGWSDAAELGEFLHEAGRVQAHVPGAHRFLASYEGRPVAAGGVFVHDGVALLAGASTIPSARRKGAQLALLNARLRFAAAEGCDLAMMGALPGSGSQRNAERNGFRIAYTRVKWILE
jgi:GNAT superfamily N-acetyltransferase